MKYLKSKPRFGSCLLFSMIFFFLLLSACSGDRSDSDETSSDTGSISFNLAWQNPATKGNIQPAQSPSGDVCIDYAIDTVDVNVEDSSNNIVASESWPCSAHQGTISGVPTGSGMTLTIDGTVAGNVDWRNQTTGITVSGGQNTNVGTVVMNYIGSDVTPPTVATTYPTDGATGIFLDAVITATFSEDVVAASVNTSSCTLTPTGAPSTPVACTVSYNSSARKATITPATMLADNTDYTVTITTDVEDLASIHMTSDDSWSFTTGTATAQTLVWDTNNWDEAVWD
jgi:hypothetical protein